LSRIFIHGSGDTLMHPLASFHSREDAETGAQSRKQEADALMQCQMVQMLDAGGGQAMMDVKDFLFDYMGFRQVGYAIQEIDEHMGPEILTPPEKKIILA